MTNGKQAEITFYSMPSPLFSQSTWSSQSGEAVTTASFMVLALGPCGCRA